MLSAEANLEKYLYPSGQLTLVEEKMITQPSSINLKYPYDIIGKWHFS
jgi:hypothetical protein